MPSHRRAASAAHEVIDPPRRPAAVLVPFYPVLQEMFVAGDRHADVVPAEEVIGLFRELHGAWQTLAEQQGRPTAEANLAAPARVAVR